jgi:hypothetical protein
MEVAPKNPKADANQLPDPIDRVERLVLTTEEGMWRWGMRRRRGASAAGAAAASWRLWRMAGGASQTRHGPSTAGQTP